MGGKERRVDAFLMDSTQATMAFLRHRLPLLSLFIISCPALAYPSLFWRRLRVCSWVIQENHGMVEERVSLGVSKQGKHSPLIVSFMTSICSASEKYSFSHTYRWVSPYGPRVQVRYLWMWNLSCIFNLCTTIVPDRLPRFSWHKCPTLTFSASLFEAGKSRKLVPHVSRLGSSIERGL